MWGSRLPIREYVLPRNGEAGGPPGANRGHLRPMRSRGEVETVQDTFLLGVGAQKAGTTWLAHYLDHVPGAQLRIGCATPGARAPFLHSPLFDVDERVIALGTRILLSSALVLACDAEAASDNRLA